MRICDPALRCGLVWSSTLRLCSPGSASEAGYSVSGPALWGATDSPGGSSSARAKYKSSVSTWGVDVAYVNTDMATGVKAANAPDSTPLHLAGEIRGTGSDILV